MPIDPLHHPEMVHETAFVAPGAVVVGNVTVGPEASLWFGVVVRGDAEAVVIGPQTNVQDGSLLHADPGQPCVLGARVSLGHGAIVHGARVDDDVLIGMGATVLNGAHIGSGSIVAAGCVVTPGTDVPPRSLVMGLPGKVVRQTSDEDLERVRATAQHYLEFGRRYREARAPAAGSSPAATPAVGVPGIAGPEILRLLRGLAVFDGLDEAELWRVAAICRQRSYTRGQVVTTQGDDESDVFVIRAGLLEISVGQAGQGDLPPHTVVNLGEGQVVGEMALIDHGPRSATVRCVSDSCSLIVMQRQAFEQLCATDHHIGLVVYRNLAADLSFKLRHRHLARR
jgi:carbonic anhydrase/acetyltransferase-like protein (isoleucine patch superfamily)